jgi:hypothetical protein
MFGKTLRGRTYYACQPGLNLGQAAADRHPDHPGSIWVRESGLLDGLHQLLDERVFGPDRRDYWRRNPGMRPPNAAASMRRAVQRWSARSRRSASVRTG